MHAAPLALRTRLAAAAIVLPALAWPAPAAAAAPVAWGRTDPAPAGSRAELFGIAAAAPDAVFAVGGTNPGEVPTAVLTRPYAARWDGASWTTTPLDAPVLYAAQSARLEGAAMLGPDDGWAVGHVDDVASLAASTLAYRWNGAQWLRVPTPDPAPPGLGSRLRAVVARAADEAYAAGEAGYPARSLLLRWNGAAWSEVAAPDIGALVAAAFGRGGLWLASASRVQGTTADGWETLPPLPVQASETLQLAGIAWDGTPGRALWAVGRVLVPYFEGIIASPYAAVWQDGRWQRASTPGRDYGYTGVVPTALGLRAAGGNGSIWRLSPGGASADATPALGAARLNAIAADPAGRAWAAGTVYGGTGIPQPALVNAPGIGQGGIAVATGFAGAAVSWFGPASGSGTADVYGRFQVGGLPAGNYTVIAAGAACTPGLTEAKVGAGRVRSIEARVQCP